MANCVLTNTFAELNGQTAAIVPTNFPAVLSAVPAAQPDNSFYALYNSTTGALTLEFKINGTPVSVDIGTAPTGL